MSILFRITHTLNDQRMLCRMGPLIPAWWAVTPNDAPSPNKPSDRNMQGNMLLDTGAGDISIDEAVVERLGLLPLPEKRDVHGLGGKLSVKMYSPTLIIPVETMQAIGATAAGTSAMMGFTLPAHGLVGLQANHEAHDLRAANGLPIIGILGRSFLQFTKCVYDGLSGNLVIDIDDSINRPRK
jgi:hypothetical protein